MFQGWFPEAWSRSGSLRLLPGVVSLRLSPVSLRLVSRSGFPEARSRSGSRRLPPRLARTCATAALAQAPTRATTALATARTSATTALGPHLRYRRACPSTHSHYHRAFHSTHECYHRAGPALVSPPRLPQHSLALWGAWAPIPYGGPAGEARRRIYLSTPSISSPMAL